jgi:hypothetical protein
MNLFEQQAKKDIEEFKTKSNYVVYAEEITKKSIVVEADNITDAYLKASKTPHGLFREEGYKSFHILASDIKRIVV